MIDKSTYFKDYYKKNQETLRIKRAENYQRNRDYYRQKAQEYYARKNHKVPEDIQKRRENIKQWCEKLNKEAV